MIKLIVKPYKHILFLIIILSLLAGAGLSGSAAASQQMTFDSVQVGLWPEQTGQSVYISMELKLSSAVVLPQELVLQIPATAGINLLMNVDERGSVQQAVWEETSGELWKDVRFTATASNILLEYTDPTLVYFDQLRTYNYVWLSSYPASDLVIAVHQPYGAGELVTHPEADEIDPCCIHTINAGRMTGGVSYGVTLHYVKDLSNADFPALAVSPVAAVNENTAGRTFMPSTVVVWLLAFALLLILLVGFYYWWYQRRFIQEKNSNEDNWLMRRSEQKAIFCHECGSRSQPTDTFCRNCGTELRKKE